MCAPLATLPALPTLLTLPTPNPIPPLPHRRPAAAAEGVVLTVVTLDAVMEVVSISAAALSTPHKLKAIVVAASWVSLMCAPATRPFTRIALYILYDRLVISGSRSGT